MKSGYKQTKPTIQKLIDEAQQGGGGTVDAYTKAEADITYTGWHMQDDNKYNGGAWG